uniref:Family with sequence similarity 193, member B n=1 Tax=Nothobranchius korthausae TaxID=1143690 RepID=A0A1A8FHP8_9TELE
MEYTKQLLLSCLLNICSRLSPDGGPVPADVLDEDKFSVELVVQCIRASDMPQTHHHALLLLGAVAAIFPEKVLHNIMPIFTFMGANIMRLDDVYSFRVIEKTLQMVIPALIQAHQLSDGSSSPNMVAVVTRIMLVFTDALPHVPEHRRLPILSQLVSTLGPAHFLWILLLLLLKLHATQNGGEKEATLERDADFWISLSCEFSVGDQLTSLVNMLNFLLQLPDDKDDAAVKRPTGRKAGKKKEDDEEKVEELIFSVDAHSSKELRHFKFLCLSFMAQLLGSSSFVQKVAAEGDTVDSSLQQLQQRLLEEILRYIHSVARCVEENADKPTAKFWRVLLNKAYDVLDKVNALLPTDTFITVMRGLMGNQLASVRRKAMELLNNKLLHRTQWDEQQVAVLLQLTSDLLIIVSKSQSKVSEEAEQAINRQTALYSLKLLCRSFGSSHQQEFVPVLQQAVDIVTTTGEEKNVTGSALLCIAEVVSSLKALAIPQLPRLMPAVLQALTSRKELLTNEVYLLSVVTALQRVTETLPHFISPYLQDITLQVCRLTRLIDTSSSSSSSATSSSSCGAAVSAHASFSPLVPNLHSPTAKLGSPSPDSPTSVHKPSPCKNSHIPAVNIQHNRVGTSLMGCSHSCNGHSQGNVANSNLGHLTAGACRDQACKGHKVTNGVLCHPSSELEEGEDEDSSSERSSCASSSTNQKDGKYCDCCYCEFFGHNAPPAAPTSRNYAEIREKLRSRLTRRKEELPQRQDSELMASGAIDNRDVDELLDFINSSEPKPVNSAKAAKRARHKQKKKEKAQQNNLGAAGSEPQTSPADDAVDEPIPDGPEASRLLDWPQLELERVNSFLTSRLEEIKNTIKDSIRASFSMYDLNLDVNDFPKKAATLEGNHLLSHLNGSSDMQQIDLDLSPLSLGTFKNHLDLVNGWEDTNVAPPANSVTNTSLGLNAASKDTQRLHTTSALSKLIRAHSPEQCTSTGPDSLLQVPAQTTAKTKEDTTDPKSAAAGNGGAKSKKTKKQQRQEQTVLEQNSHKLTKAASVNEAQKANESKEGASNNLKSGNKQPQISADSQRNGPKKTEEVRSSKQATHAANGGSSGVQRGKFDTETRGGGGGSRSEQESESKAHPSVPANGPHQQQSKGKNKKNRNKGEKSSSAIDDVFLPKDVDPTEMDEIDREVEYFKRFCLDSAKQTRQKVAVNWSNFSLKKVSSNAAE